MEEEKDKKAYIEEKLNELFKQWLRKVVLWGAVIFLLLSGLDYISTPENFRLFLYYRVTTALFLVIVSRLLGKFAEKDISFHRIMAYITIVGSAAAIELMVLDHGGHMSAYYAGLILLGVCVIGFIPARFSFHLVASLLIYTIYLVPILVLDEITDLKMFFTSNIFMIAAFASILILRVLTEKGLLNELGLKYDLEKYKDHLEGVVSESTGKLDDAHEELKESEAKYQTLFSQMLNGFAYHSIEVDDGKPVDYTFIEVNDSFERLTGLHSEYVTGKRVSEVMPDIRETEFDWIGEFGKVALEGEPLTLERYFEPLQRWFAISAYSPQRGFFVTIFDDITERKQIDDALRKSEQRLASFMDSATDSFFLFDSHLRVTNVNVNASKLFGRPKEKIKGKYVSELFPELGESSRFKKIKTALMKSSRYDKYMDVLSTGDPFENDNFLLMSLSGPKYMSLKAFRVGEGLGLIATDITERKRMEDQMYRDKQDWEDTFNAITDAITIHDNDFNIVHSNKAAEEILELSERDNSNGKCFEYFHGTEAPSQNCPSCECIKTREPCISEMYEPHLGKYIEIRALPRVDKSNNVVGLIHVVRDITKRKRAEEQITRQFNRLQALRTIDVAITASLDLGHTLDVFLDQVISQLRADAVDVLLFNRYALKLEYAAGKGFRSDAVKYSRLKLGEGVAGKIAKDRRSMTIYELQEKRSDFTRNLMTDKEGFVTYFGVPLIAKGNLLGVMEIYQRSLFEPDDDWVDFLGALAGQAAIAIDNAALFNELKDSHDNLVMAYETTIEGWARALDYRDSETEGHSRRVSELTIIVAREMKIGEKELVHMQRGALLHDIGKIGVPDNILLKTDSLTDNEWKIMKKHPEFARDLLFGIPFLRKALDIPYCHHERWDGTGYPKGIKGNEIPVAARIFSVIDHWDAMTSERPYRPAIPDKKVREEIRSLAGSCFDPEVVKTFLRMDIKSN